MSTSVPCNVPYVLELIAKNLFSKVDVSTIDFSSVAEGNPLPAPEFKVLDVGAGYGKWGFLIRDTFDVLMFQSFEKNDWKVHITGVEPFEKVHTPLQMLLYDTLIKEDIFTCIDDLGQFDLVILGDVIEHFEKEDGYRLIEKLFEHSKNIIVSTPFGFIPQGAWAGNEKEIHRSGWTQEDFERYSIVESKILEDTLTKDLLRSMPNVPEEFKKPISLLVLWLQHNG